MTARSLARRALARLRRARPLVLVAVAYAYFHQGSEPNQATRFALTRAIVERGTTDIGPDHPHTVDKSWGRGAVRSDKSPFVSLAAVPAFALTRLVSGPAAARLDDTARPAELRARLHFVTFMVSGLAGLVSALLFLRIALAMGFGRRLAELCTLGYALGTNVFAFSTVLFGHVLSGALLLGGFWVAVRARVRGRDLTRPEAAGLGLLLALAGLTEYPVAVAATLVGLYVASWEVSVARARRLLLPVAAGAALPAVVHALYTLRAFGSAFTLPYRHVVAPVFSSGMSRGFFGIAAPRLDALAGVLTSPYRGTFYLSPFLALAIWGFSRWVAPGDRHRREGVVASAIVVVSVAMTASYYAWDGDLSVGPRHLVACTSFLALAAGVALRDLGRRGFALGLALVLPSIVTLWLVVAALVQLPKEDPRIADPLHRIVLPAWRRGEIPLPREDLSQVVGVRADAATNLGLLAGLPPRAAALAPVALLPIVYAWPLARRLRRRRGAR